MAKRTRIPALTSAVAVAAAVAAFGAGLGAGVVGAAAPARAAAQPETVVDGLGFDTCTAPDDAEMDDWLAHSPYRAVGVYIGGPSYERLGCAHGYTAEWVKRQAARGWRMWAMYCGAQVVDLTAAGADPAALGARDAADADAHARALGFGPGTTIFADIEHYKRSPGAAMALVAYLRAFAGELRTRSTPAGTGVAEYRLGVYGSASSAIADLAAEEQGSKGLLRSRSRATGAAGSAAAPGLFSSIVAALDIAAWADPAAGHVPDTSDPRLRPGQWEQHERIHQYYGNHVETYGSTTLSVDADRLDMGAWAASPPPVLRVADPDPVASAVEASGLLWRDASDVRSTRRAAHAAVLAPADDVADALGGVPLAARAEGPLLVTAGTALDPRVGAELTRTLRAGSTVYVLDGDKAVPSTVEKAVRQAGFRLRRLQGRDRYATAAVIARLMAGQAFREALPEPGDPAGPVTAAVISDRLTPGAGNSGTGERHPASAGSRSGPSRPGADGRPASAASRRHATSPADATAPTQVFLADGRDPDALLAAATAGALPTGLLLLTDGTALPPATVRTLQHLGHDTVVHPIGAAATAAAAHIPHAAVPPSHIHPLTAPDRSTTATTLAAAFFPHPALFGRTDTPAWPATLTAAATTAALAAPLLFNPPTPQPDTPAPRTLLFSATPPATAPRSPLTR